MTIVFSQLRAFHAVAESGGFTAAARVLNVGQPTLTIQVKELEGEIVGWKKRADNLNEKNLELNTQNEQLKVKLKGCEREVDRQKTEFQNEIESLKMNKAD